MNPKSGLTYSFAALAAVSVLAHADEAAAASTHTVRSGDTLWSISRSYDLSVSALKSLNGLTSDSIRIGQTLQVSDSGSTGGSSLSTSSTTRMATTDALNLRSGAGTSHRILLTIPKGKVVTPIQTNGSWSKVSYGGQTGWVHNGYLKKTSTSTPTTPAPTTPPNVKPSATTAKTTVNLNLRASKSTKASIVLTIPKGKAVTVLKREGSWSQVKYGSRTGYVAHTYLTTSGSATPSTPVTTTPTPSTPSENTVNQQFVTTANLNVRQGAGIGYALVTNIPNGTIVQATKKSGDWYFVTYNGKSGYVSAGYLKQTTTTPSNPAPNAGDNGAGNAEVDYVVNTPSLNVRSSASTNATIIGSVKAGQTLRVVQASNGWLQIYYGNTVGFVASAYVKTVSKDSTGTEGPTWVEGSYDANSYYTYYPTAIRAQANESSSTVGSTLRGELLNVIGETTTHYKLASGFVAKSAVTEIKGQNAQATRLATIQVAKQYVGTPYVWASSSPSNGGFDCSGLIYYVFNQSGVSIPRTNVANYWAGAYFGPQLPTSFVPQAGDLVFFENTYTTGPSHMGIMINADTFIHAGSFGLGYNQISKEPYWQSRLIGYKRP
ncbi:SH3 domain-containing protein [Exiguobacterium sp. B2(2022)]|uniref:SH3 domain-containing protein n=1 Tax=Exiguobacterium sp. B2(2022) TaxID=2992755 RepID=UPI00237BA5D9|nr:SH3 domain-containing protein [Exiguobacterium sp. B2(2022)]MDE0564810.1 SH3 domain-containing protein [Exiguobacterium sp. B2(2022)]